MTVTPKGSTENCFMEKLGIEPATPGLQNIGLSPTPRRHIILMLKSRHFLQISSQDYYVTLFSGIPFVGDVGHFQSCSD